MQVMENAGNEKRMYTVLNINFLNSAIDLLDNVCLI